MKINAKTEDIINCLWYACASGPQTYQRTDKSKQNYDVHVWRIFTGKLGEYLCAKWFLSMLIENQKQLNYDDAHGCPV